MEIKRKIAQLKSKIKEKLEDPKFQKEALDLTVNIIASTVGVTVVYAITKSVYKRGLDRGWSECALNGNRLVDTLIETGYYTLDELKRNESEKLLKERGITYIIE